MIEDDLYQDSVGRACRPATATTLWIWEALQESLRNYACKGAQKGTTLKSSQPPSVYLYGLSQAPLAMHRRSFRFPPLRCLNKAQAERKARW